MLAFTAPTPDSLSPSLSAFINGPRKVHYQLFDTPTELADYAAAREGKHVAAKLSTGFNLPSFYSANAKFRDGDLSGVDKSDALLSRFDRADLQTSARAWRDDVVGAFPNIPAFLAGHPMNMRRRTRRDSAYAPLAIIIDIGAAQDIESHQIATRGAAVLALVRALSGVRPIELWAGAVLGADTSRNASATFCRIETSPLDLAHAAHILTTQSAIRQTVWAAATEHGFTGRFPFGCNWHEQATEQNTRALIMPAFSHVTEALVLPRITSANSQTFQDPAAWIEAQIAAYAPQDAA